MMKDLVRSRVKEVVRNIRKDANKLESALLISDAHLDDVVKEQPALYYRAGQLCAFAVEERDTIKDEVALITSDEGLNIRRELEAGGDRVTEALVNSRVAVSKRVKKARKRLAEWNGWVEQTQNLKAAFAQRSFAIRDLVSLSVHSLMQDSSIKAADTAKYSANRKKLATHRKRGT